MQPLCNNQCIRNNVDRCWLEKAAALLPSIVWQHCSVKCQALIWAVAAFAHVTNWPQSLLWAQTRCSVAKSVKPYVHAYLLLKSDGGCNSHPFPLKALLLPGCQNAVLCEEWPFTNVREIRISHCWKIEDLGEDVPIWSPFLPAVGGGLFSARLAKGSWSVDRRSRLAVLCITM